MENGSSQYKKIGIAAGTLFFLMMIGFFVFVFFDHQAPKDHAQGHAPAEQVEEHAAPADHAAPDNHAASGDHAPSDSHEPSDSHGADDDHAASDTPADGHGEETTH